LLGATAGYVSLLTADGSHNDVVFLDTGDIVCTVDPDLPMPIRGLRAEVYRTGRPVYDNRFADSSWQVYLPAGHSRLDSVLFAPLVLSDKVVGLMGLANKPGGFTDHDAQLAAAFGELAAVALNNSRTLEALERSEEQFRSVVQTAGEAIVTIDSQAKIVFWNAAAEDIFGYSASEAIGQSLEIIMPGRYREAHRQAFRRIGATGQATLTGKAAEMVGKHRDGSELPMELALSVWALGDTRYLTGVIHDIRERKEAEAALRRSRDELEARVAARTAELSRANELLLAQIAERAAVEAQLRASEERFLQLAQWVDEIFWVYELDANRFLYISPRYESIFGRTCQSLYDEAESFLQAVHPEDRDRVAEAFRRVGEGYDVEYRIIRPDGSLRWITARGFPIPDEKGEAYRVAGMASDITEEKQAQAALIRTERLAVAGKLAASLAHEVNNPLQSAIGCLDLAQEAMAEGKDAERYLQVVSDALLRTTRVVRQLLDLPRRSSEEARRRLDLRQTMEQVLLLVRKKCEHQGIDIVWEAEETLPALEFMPDAMHQVFLNLVLNAIDAMQQGGTLRVSMARTDQPLGVSTAVQDDGVGIPAESVAMAFDPFYSTKADGLGMGLFISLSTVQAHGGDIEVQSREGEGSRFTVWLPG
jgi:PAS domain S-box-containing protein